MDCIGKTALQKHACKAKLHTKICMSGEIHTANEISRGLKKILHSDVEMRRTELDLKKIETRRNRYCHICSFLLVAGKEEVRLTDSQVYHLPN